MSDFPVPNTVVTPTHVHTASILSGAYDAQGLAESATIGTMASWGEKLAAFTPVYIPWPYPVARVFWVNGSAAGGNVDFGVYTGNGVRLLSAGATVATGNSEIQYVDTPDVLLAAGFYYFALVNDSATTANRFFGLSSISANIGRMGGMLQMAAAAPLPTTATFAAWASTGIPLCGITKTASGF